MPAETRDERLRSRTGLRAANVGGKKFVAVVGNPNAGKTTLFNSLTGSFQKVGNYPGVTVEKVSGTLKFSDITAEVVDVPGLYSLVPVSEDERVAVDVIRGAVEEGTPDLLLYVLDAGNLERNLFFYTQVAELGIPTVVALTMVDRVQKEGKEIDLARLSDLLGCEVVPVVGHRSKGLDDLRAAIERNLRDLRPLSFRLQTSDPLDTRVALLRERMARLGANYSSSEIRKGLLSPTEEFATFLADFPEIEEAFQLARKEIEESGTPPEAPDVATRYQWSAMVQHSVIGPAQRGKRASFSDRLDAILVHRVFGLIIFVGLMYLVFQSIYTFAQPLMDGIQWVFDSIGGWVSPKLESMPIVQSLVVDGIIAGVGAMLVFLPQILILFFFVAVLEGTGYLARAAFLMDRLLGWCGLNGRAFIPLLSSFACAIPGIMAARVMPDKKSRLATILVAPLMSCSARLPVYLLLISAFIYPKFGAGWAGFTLFAMHFLGLLVAIPIVFIFNRSIIKGKRLPFLLELPPYQWPRWRDVWLAMYFRGRVFVKTAGTIIVFMSFLIWALSYFPRSTEDAARYRADYVATHVNASDDEIDRHVQEEQSAHSYLGRFGKTIEPVFLPAGFDWRITTSILAAFPARETVVPSLGIMFNQGKDVDEGSSGLQKSLQEAKWPDGSPLFTGWTAIGLMVFFALCAQCMATLATVKRETNSWKWAAFMFTYMTVLAYLAAVGIHQLSKLF